MEPFQLRVPDIPGSYYDRIMEARWREERGEWEEAAAIYQRVVDRISNLPERRRPADSDLNLYLAASAAGLVRARANLGDFEAAQRLCEKLELWDAEDAHRWRLRVHVLRIDQGLVDEGLAGLQQLADSDPDNFDYWYTLANEAIDARRFDLAEQALARATDLAPDAKPDSDQENALAEVYFTWFDFYREQRRWQEAGREWDKALALDPAVEESQEKVLRMFLEAELWDDAQRYLGGALAGPVGDYYQAFIAYRRGDKVRARHLWRKLVEADQEEERLDRNVRAMAWCYLDEPFRALDILLHEVTTSRELQARVALILALAWSMEGNAEAARADLGIATKILRESAGAKFSQLDWYDFEELVQDEAIKAELRAALRRRVPEVPDVRIE